MNESFPPTPLPRWKACVNCRHSDTLGDCGYTEEGGPANTEMLEEQISILQARIAQLEHPKDQRTTAPQASNFAFKHDGLGPAYEPFLYVPESVSEGLNNSNASDLQQTPGASANQSTTSLMPTELPFIVLQALVHNFLHNATCFGFFLDIQAFHDAVTSTNRCNLPPILLNVMYLWGVHLSEDERITAYEPAFLAHALRTSANSLTGSHPRTVLHSIQACVLLAYYFIRNARFLEGKYHTSAAVSIALSAGLHRIRSADGGALPPTGEVLSPPTDTREEGERIDAFWSVLTLNNCWASMEGSPSNVTYGSTGLKIDTPWPLEIGNYVEASAGLGAYIQGLTPSSDTIARFLVNDTDDESSEPALHAKAALLFESATRISARHRTGGISPNDPEFISLDRKIDAFTGVLPPIQSKAMLVVHTLARVATIKLHNPLVNEHTFARSNALSAARGVVGILAKTDVPSIGLIDPVLAASLSITISSVQGWSLFVTRMMQHGSETKDRTGNVKSRWTILVQFFQKVIAERGWRRSSLGTLSDRRPEPALNGFHKLGVESTPKFSSRIWPGANLGIKPQPKNAAHNFQGFVEHFQSLLASLRARPSEIEGHFKHEDSR
ncbi:hypothetical protein FB451DRAFT_1525658 [Mycena latifolia]|nr:hypothetical protein FB451DRAFT_1525658 [Mycena latifolia]